MLPAIRYFCIVLESISYSITELARNFQFMCYYVCLYMSALCLTARKTKEGYLGLMNGNQLVLCYLV